MKCWNTAGKARLAAAAALLVTMATTPSWVAAQQNTKGELKCHSLVSKAIAKHVAAVTKAMATCENAKLADPMITCPDTTAQTAIDKSAESAAKAVTKKCQSTCSGLTALSCIDSDTCPPNGKLRENCTAGGKNPFEASSMGFPGPFCTGILGGSMVEPEDFGTCATGMGSVIADEILDNVYGSLASPPTSGPAACLSAIVKAVPKAALQISGAVSKCRGSILGSESQLFLPSACATADEKTATKIATFIDKFKTAIAKSCTDDTVDGLDLCGAGLGATTTLLDAQNCLAQMVREVADSTDLAELRDYADTSIINAAYPSSALPRCGDNIVNQLPNQFALNGEECDGTDDSNCPGECLPPGDTFECTCSSVRRARVFAYGFEADLDNGWTGASHNSKVTDGAGFVSEVSNCDCLDFDETDKATCKPGQSSDPLCDVEANLAPRCSNRNGDGTTCDQVGITDGVNDDSDCRACDAYSANPDEFCIGAARFCVGGANNGVRCNTPADCPGGGTCPTLTGSGRCLDGPFVGNGCTGSVNCGICVGGSNNGNTCATPANCPGGACETHVCAFNVCLGGDNDDTPCDADGDCTGGGRCAETSDCGAQCYNADGMATGPCARQSDCTGEGERCRGACANNTCVVLRNGAPLPLSAKGTSVCIDSRFHSNMTGTRNLYTGSHDVNYELRSLVLLSGGTLPQNARPCPVCGGWCEQNDPAELTDVLNCEGTCNGGTTLQCRFGPSKGATCVTDGDCGGYLCTNLPCRFQSDCDEDGGGTCSGESSPECGGRACRLDLACGGGSNHGESCRIEAATVFGTTSTDCPSDGPNQSGAGLEIVWTPLTSSSVTLKNPAPCNASGFQNYNCNCVTGGGALNKPNDCDPACTDPDPAYFGRRCTALTVCVGGAEAGVACDQNSDCTGGVCTGNPKVCGNGSNGTCSVSRCVGGANAGDTCLQPGQCDSNVCSAPSCVVGGAPCSEGYCKPADCVTAATCTNGATCDDACPAGKCTPFCVQRGHCDGGPKDGLFCATDNDCLGGTCTPEPSDENEGACAQGFFNHCDGPGWEFQSCAPDEVNSKRGCEWGTDSIEGNANDNIGAGYCRADVKQCFVNNGFAEGGTTINGKGDPTNTFSVTSFCIPASSGSTVNNTSGLPGPGRIRQRALVVPNYDVLP